AVAQASNAPQLDQAATVPDADDDIMVISHTVRTASTTSSTSSEETPTASTALGRRGRGRPKGAKSRPYEVRSRLIERQNARRERRGLPLKRLPKRPASFTLAASTFLASASTLSSTLTQAQIPSQGSQPPAYPA